MVDVGGVHMANKTGLSFSIYILDICQHKIRHIYCISSNRDNEHGFQFTSLLNISLRQRHYTDHRL